MHPILFTVFGHPVYAFGVMIALAFLLGALWIVQRGKAQGFSEELFLEATLWIVVSGLVGARLFYIFFFPALFFKDPFGVLFNQGGLVWYGGMIAVTLTVWLFCKRHQIAFNKLGDIVTPPAALGLAIGRIGCLLAGCCYGAPCELPWAIQYPPGHETFPHHVHPSPLYESISLLIVTFLLAWIDRYKKFDGATTWLFFVLYGIVRFVLEYYRGDRLVWLVSLNLSASQVISLAGIALGLIMLGILVSQKSTQKKNHRQLI